MASVHLQVPHSQVPRPLQICLLLARHVLLSREQSQALPVHMGSHLHTRQSHVPWPGEGGGGGAEFGALSSLYDRRIYETPGSSRFVVWSPLTPAELVVVAVAAEVVALAEAAAVALLGVVPDLALAHAAHALPVVAADVRAVVLAAVAVHVLRGHVVAAALAVAAHPPLVAPEGPTGR